MKRKILVIFSICLPLLSSPASAIEPNVPSDFNGDGAADFAVFDSNSKIFTFITRNGAKLTRSCGQAGDTPLSGDFDGNGVAEPVVWRPRDVSGTDTNGARFIVCYSGSTVEVDYGSPGDIPITTGDYNGDGLTDLTLFRPATGEWFESFPGSPASQKFGKFGDIPVPADFDGDAFTDEAVYRPSTGEWFVLRAADEKEYRVVWGRSGDIPVPGDYDGDGRSDYAVFRPSQNRWIVRPANGDTGFSYDFGAPGDLPTPRDLDNDGDTDLALYRPSTGSFYFRLLPGGGQTIETNEPFQLIANHRLPHVAANDFDGDRRSDLGVVRPIHGQQTWRIADADLQPLPIIRFGIAGDRMFARDYTGDGIVDATVVRGTNGYIDWFINPSSGAAPYAVSWGLGEDQLLASDFDADHKADLTAVRKTSSGQLVWFIRSSLTGETLSRNWGLNTDAATAGDFDGNGTADFVVIRDVNGFLFWFVSSPDPINPKTIARQNLNGTQWGLAGDTPIAADFDGDGRADFGVVRNQNGLLYLYVRLSSGSNLAPVQWGLAGDSFLSGNYSGAPGLQVAVWRPSDTPLFLIKRASSTESLTWGQTNDEALMPFGTILAPGVSPEPPAPPPPPPGSGDLGTVCPTIKPFSSGTLWKPSSDDSGPPRQGKPAFLVKSNPPPNSCLNIYAANGQVVSKLGLYEANGKYGSRWYTGWGCGDRKAATEIASAASASAGSSSVYVQRNTGECVGPLNPTQRTGSL